jgi:hypothetical protein
MFVVGRLRTDDSLRGRTLNLIQIKKADPNRECPFRSGSLADNEAHSPRCLLYTPKGDVRQRSDVIRPRLKSFPLSCRRAGNCHSACLQAHRLARRGSDKRSSRSKPDMDIPITTGRFFAGKK